MSPRTAVVSLVHGRHSHLHRQHEALSRSTVRPDLHAVVAMDDPDATAELLPLPPRPLTVRLPVAGADLPLAAARNLGAERALGAGCEVLVFLDVDCIPSTTMVSRYLRSLDQARGAGVHCGPVAYLPQPPPGGYPRDGLAALAAPHPGRPVPDLGRTVLGTDADYRLFWSLSFSLTARTWRKVGGFCEDYTGYGGEDTDYGQLLRSTAVPLYWTGGATAYHQHHPVQDPPVQHLDSILRNAAVFHRRWGWWPMEGWLRAFESLGLAHRDPRTGAWARTGPQPQP